MAGVPAHFKGDFLDRSRPHIPLLFPDPPLPSEWRRRRNSCLFPSHASQPLLLLGEEPGNKGEAPRAPALERGRAPARYRALCHWSQDQCLAWCWAGGIRVSRAPVRTQRPAPTAGFISASPAPLGHSQVWGQRQPLFSTLPCLRRACPPQLGPPPQHQKPRPARPHPPQCDLETLFSSPLVSQISGV